MSVFLAANSIKAAKCFPRRITCCTLTRKTIAIYSYECGCDELKKLYEIMVDTDGIYGGRFSGAGFKGCCMALIAPDKAEDIEAKVSSEYLKAFPALEGKYSFHLCESADGVEL